MAPLGLTFIEFKLQVLCKGHKLVCKVSQMPQIQHAYVAAKVGYHVHQYYKRRGSYNPAWINQNLKQDIADTLLQGAAVGAVAPATVPFLDSSAKRYKRYQVSRSRGWRQKSVRTVSARRRRGKGRRYSRPYVA